MYTFLLGLQGKDQMRLQSGLGSLGAELTGIQALRVPWMEGELSHLLGGSTCFPVSLCPHSQGGRPACSPGHRGALGLGHMQSPGSEEALYLERSWALTISWYLGVWVAAVG